MTHFMLRSDKRHILCTGQTNVAGGQVSWLNKCQVGQMLDRQMLVGQMSVRQKSGSVMLGKCKLCKARLGYSV